VLKTVKNFDELDFLLAHEASHILYDHFTEEEERKKIEQAIGIGILIASLVTRRADADTQNAVAWTSLGLLVANTLLGPAWTRQQEEESDELGFELLMEAGKSSDGANNVMERFQQRDDARNAYLDVMCGPDSAGEHFLKGLIGSFFGIKIPDKGYDPTNPVCEERRNILGSLLRGYEKPSERRKNLEKHQKKYYADRKPVNLTPIGTGQISLIEFLSPEGASSRLVKAYEGLEAFRRGDLAKARSIEKSLPSKGKDELQLAVLELRFLIANADGKRALALGFLEDATTVPEPSLRLSLLAETEYARDGRWADAARIVKRRLQRKLASPIQALPLIIRYFKLAGKSAELEKTLAECRAMAVEQPPLLLACEAEATRTDLPGTAPSPAPVGPSSTTRQTP
jgi:predicted Zn-dependent protease